MNFNNIEKLLISNGFIFKNFQTVESTMDTIKDLITNNNYKFFVVSDKQTKGKGRRNTEWISNEGNLFFSLSFDLKNYYKNFFIFNLITSLCVSDTIDEICNIKSKIKWPNDILVNKNKISGVISELYKINNKNIIILGVGINVASSPKITNYPTTYAKFLNPHSSINDILELFIGNFYKIFNKIENSNYNSLLDNFKKKLLYLGEDITIKINNSNFLKGRFENIDDDGSMLININGEKKKLYSARIINDSN